MYQGDTGADKDLFQEKHIAVNDRAYGKSPGTIHKEAAAFLLANLRIKAEVKYYTSDFFADILRKTEDFVLYFEREAVCNALL